MWRYEIELGQLVESIVLGEVIKTWEYASVYANKKSVKQSEFYNAANVSLKPELVFEVNSDEFNNEERVRFDGREYEIIRTFDSGEGIMELIVSGLKE